MKVNKYKTFKEGDKVIVVDYNHDKTMIMEVMVGIISFGEFWISADASHENWLVCGWFLKCNNEIHSLASFDEIFKCQ